MSRSGSASEPTVASAAAARPRHALGRSVFRSEDPRLLTGGGRYVDDIPLAGALHMCLVRSPVAHGRLRSVDPGAALRADGTELVLDARGLEALGVGEIPTASAIPGQRNTANPVLARDTVRYAGQPVAAVLATDRYLAEDAASLVALEIDPLPAVADVVDAVEPDAQLLYDDWGTNVAADGSIGEGGDDAFPGADVVVGGRFRIHRHAGIPLEPRGILAVHDPLTGATTAWISTQSPHHVRTALAEILGWPEHRLRVVAPDVGGAFGTKEYPMPEDVLACALARHTGRPVKWVSDAREHFSSTVHAREQVWEARLAADPSGRIRALRGRLLYDAGAHFSSNGLAPAMQSAGLLPGPYDIADYSMEVLGVVTNKVPAGAYRGFGVPQAAFVMERLMDDLARRVGLDPAEVRRRNLIPAEAQPYRAASGRTYDSGDYAQAMERALELIGYERFPERREHARSRGRCLGLGLASFVMPSGLAPSPVLASHGARFGAWSSALVRMDPSGCATVYTGASSQGQGTGTSLAQICAARLGLDPETDVTTVMGDTAIAPYEPAGSVSARITAITGGAVYLAADRLRRKIVTIAARMLEASDEDLELSDGKVFVRGSPAGAVPIAEVARRAHSGSGLPSGVEPGLEASGTHEPEGTTYPYGAHAAIVEVDVETGAVRVVSYAAVHDSGTIVNAALAEGQVHGAIAQGLGGALLERLVYDRDAQLLTTSHMDYLMPTAMEVPPLSIELLETPAPQVPGGMKGIGESPIVGPAAAVANAVADALSPMRERVAELPLDPERVRLLARLSETR